MHKKLDHTEESLLWQGIAEGKEEPYKFIFEYYYVRLLRFGLGMCFDKALVKDCIQEVFLHIWNRRERIPQINNHSAYLMQVLKRKISKAIKQQRRQYGQAETDQSILSYESLLIEQQEAAAQKKQLKKAFEQLSPRQREIIELRFLKGLSYEEIATQSDVRKRTIYNQVHAALKVLKKSMLLQLLFFFQ